MYIVHALYSKCTVYIQCTVYIHCSVQFLTPPLELYLQNAKFHSSGIKHMKSEVNEDASLEIFFLFDGVGPPSLKLYLQNAEFHNCGMKYVKSKVFEGVILQFFFLLYGTPPPQIIPTKSIVS